METTSRSISFEVDYFGEESLRQILVGMNRMPWYRRILVGRLQLFLTFIFFTATLYFFVGLNAASVLLAAAMTLAVRAFISFYVFEWISWGAIYFEKRAKVMHGIAPTFLTKFEFNDLGITVDHVDQSFITKYSHSVTKWTDVFEAIETESDLIIFYDEGGAYLFPKRIFQEFDEMNSFKTFITQKIGNQAIF
jgi:hypothetical protein